MRVVATPYGDGVTMYGGAVAELITEGEVNLWYAVVKRAIDDARWLRDLPEDSTFHTKRQRWVVGQILCGGSPEVFLRGEFCRTLCQALEVALPEDV